MSHDKALYTSMYTLLISTERVNGVCYYGRPM